MRAIFTVYLAVVVLGLAYFFVLGVMHRLNGSVAIR